MHVPAEDNRAEAKARLGDREELLLGDNLASKLAIDIDAGQLYLVVIFEQL